MSKEYILLTHNKAKYDRCGGTGVGAAWAQESFQRMCRFFCMPPKGSAPDPPDGLTSLSEWRTILHSPWRHVRAHRKTPSSLCFKNRRDTFVGNLGSTKLWHEKKKKNAS